MTVTRMRCDQGTFYGVCLSDCVSKLESLYPSSSLVVLTRPVFERVSLNEVGKDYEQAANDRVHASDSVKFNKSL